MLTAFGITVVRIIDFARGKHMTHRTQEMNTLGTELQLKDFIDAYDSHAMHATSPPETLTDWYAYLKLPNTGAFTIGAITDEIHRRIALAFQHGHNDVALRCKAMREELIQEHVFGTSALDPYYGALSLIADYTGNASGNATVGTQDWQAAIGLAILRDQLRPCARSDEVARIHQRSFFVAQAAWRMMQQGYQIRRVRNKMYFEEESEKRLIALAETLVKKIGGITMAKSMFHQIGSLYDQKQERYHLVRQTGFGQRLSPQFPFGFLLHLVAKHPVGKKPYDRDPRTRDKLIALLADYACVLDIEPYGFFGWAAMDTKAILSYAQESALYDFMFCLPQIRGRDIPHILRGLVDKMDLSQLYGTGWSIAQALIVIEAVLTISRDRRGPLRLSLEDIASACDGVAQADVRKVIDDMLCHPAQGANQRFERPADSPDDTRPFAERNGTDFNFRPLIRADASSYYLLDRAACSLGCVEALLIPIRAVHKNFDGKQLGPATERLLRQEFKARGIATLSGKYRVQGRQGECDIVVEAGDTIFFIEIKKKSLTRSARAGSDAALLLDLAASLVEAQTQAGWHEVVLRQHGALELRESDDITHRLELNGRKIERIAVTLLDYGAFQDRIFIGKFLEACLSSTYSSGDERVNERLKTMNGHWHEIRTQLHALHAGEAQIDQPFFHCWFLSLPQLLVVLDDVQGAEEFKTKLATTRHSTTGSQDFYWEHTKMLQLRAGATSAPEAGRLNS